MATNDLALLARWTRDRDPEAFAEVARRHAGMVYGACRRILGNPADAEDAAQECFLVLAQTGAPPKSNLGAWLHRVAVNKARDRARSDHQRRNREHRYASAHPTASEVEWRDVEAYVDEAIAALPDEFRESLVAHFMEGHSHAEIAERLGVSRQTVTYRVNKGVESIRDSLRKRGLQIAVPSLVFGLTANMAEAAPATLVTAIGKLAVSGAPVAAAGTTIAGLLTLKNALIAVSVVAVVTVGAVLIPRTPRPTTINSQQPGAAPLNAAQSIESASPSDASSGNTNSTGVSNAAPADAARDWRVLTGVVVDASGTPIRLPPDADGNALPSQIHVRSFRTDTPGGTDIGGGTQIINDDGSFVIDTHDAQSKGVVHATNWEENLISDFVSFSLTPDGTHYVTLQLLPGARISGTFLDADNQPIPDTHVSAYSEELRFQTGSPVDSAGKFDIGPLPPGTFRINPSSTKTEGRQYFGLADAVVEVSRGEEHTGVNLKYNKHRSALAGIVVDNSGHPVPGVQVVATSVRTDFRDMRSLASVVGTADAAGRFDMPVYAPQTFTLSVQRVENNTVHDLPLEGTVESEAGDRTISLTLQDFFLVSGRVVRSDSGEPVNSFSVRVISSDGRANIERVFEGRQGRFTFLHADAPGVTVEVTAPHLSTVRKEITVAKGMADLEFRLRPEDGLRGRVVDSRGQPIENAVIVGHLPFSLNGRSLEETALAKTGADGEFELSGPALAKERVFVVADGFAPAATPITRTKDWTITLTEGSAIEGAVTIAGNPQPGQQVIVFLRAHSLSASGSINFQSVCDDGGRYRVTGLSAGTAEVQVSLPLGGNPIVTKNIRKKVEIPDSGTTTVDFDVRPADASLSGHVYLGGKPARAEVMVSTPSDDGDWSGNGRTTDPDGAYRVDGLWSGPARLTATLSEGTPRTVTQEFNLVPGDNLNYDVRFADNKATLEGEMLLPQGSSVQVRMSIDIATASGNERIDYTRLPIKDNMFRIENLPEGSATLEIGWHSGQRDQSNRRYHVTLASNSVTRQDIDVGSCSVNVEVADVTPQSQLWVMAYLGQPPLPDFRAMTINEIERFNSETPPTLMVMGAEPTLAPLPAGEYTIVVLDPGIDFQENRRAIRSEDDAIPGLRYAAGIITATEDAEAIMTLSLE